MNKQTGFTLLELVIAMAIFALLGLASWTLFDGVVRVQQSSMAHEREFEICNAPCHDRTRSSAHHRAANRA
jgi:type II secretion system protein J